MADPFDTFQKEVDEDVQRQKLQELWNKYGTYAVAAVAGFIFLVAAYKYLENRRAAAAEAAGASYMAAMKALEADKGDEARKTLAGLTADPRGYGALAKLKLAAADAKAGKTAEALAGYDALSKQIGVDQLIADYARLQSAMLTIDTGSWTDVKNRLIDLAVEGNPWRHSARELLGIAAHKAGEIADARSSFERLISDMTTPPSIRERSSIMMAELVQAEMAKAQPPQAAAPQAAPANSPASTDTKAGETKTEAPAKKK